MVGSSILLSMDVQQLVVILVLLQEEISTYPSIPPSWTESPGGLNLAYATQWEVWNLWAHPWWHQRWRFFPLMLYHHYSGIYAHCPRVAAMPPAITSSFQAGVKGGWAEGVKDKEPSPSKALICVWEGPLSTVTSFGFIDQSWVSWL